MTYALGLWLAVPILLPFVLSYAVTPIYIVRSTIVALPAFYLLVARGVVTVPSRALRGVLVGALVIGLLVPLPGYYADQQKKQWRSAAEYVAANADEDDLVVVSQTYVRRPFNYYFSRTDVTVAPTPPWASPDQLAEAFAGHDEAWIIVSHMGPEQRRQLLDAVRVRAESLSHVRSYIGIEMYHADLRSDNESQARLVGGRNHRYPQ